MAILIAFTAEAQAATASINTKVSTFSGAGSGNSVACLFFPGYEMLADSLYIAELLPVGRNGGSCVRVPECRNELHAAGIFKDAEYHRHHHA